MSELITPSNLLSVVLMLAITLGGLYGFRRAYAKSLGEMQAQVIATYKEQNQAQEKQIKKLKQENVAMRMAFKQLGIEIEIDGEEITLIQDEQAPKRKRIMQVRVAAETPTPPVLQDNA